MLNKDYYILLSMVETIEKILRYTHGYQSAEELYQNDRDFDAVIMNFIVIGEEVGKLTGEFKAKNAQIDWPRYRVCAISSHIIISGLTLTLFGKLSVLTYRNLKMI